jgi:hypothetical protein
MPKPLNVDWSAVRVLAVAVGVREAARQMGISQDAVRQRSKREGWMSSPKTVAQRALAKPVTSVSPHALSPADALAHMAELRVLIAHNRVKPFLPDELCKLHEMKSTLRGTITK